MAAKKKQDDCPNCRRLEERTAKLEAELAEVNRKLAEAKKNSSNSSKPPSSDIVNPDPKQGAAADDKAEGKGKGKRKRKRGGQPGHPRHERTPFQPEEINATWIHYYTGCPCCGGQLVETDVPDKILQQVEVLEVPIRVEEHRRPTQQCLQCARLH
jgi:hypothetical protein